jgi:N4-gp56 family major capsid protein
MATESTLVTTTTTELAHWIPQLWSKKVYNEAKAKMYWQRFAGPEGSGMPVITKEELLTEPGDTINISQVAHLTGSGVTGENRLRGNEEQLSTKQVQVSPEWLRHAVADTAKASKQITQSFREKAQAGLSYWLAGKMDTSMWTAALITATAGFEASAVDRIFANDATSIDTIDSSDDFGVEEIRMAAAILEGKNIPKISVPGMPAGEGYYLMFIHPYQAYTLKKDTEWIADHQSATERGRDNPLFTGALGEIDGVILHSTTQCPVTANANTPPINTAVAICVGQEALCRGVNEDITWSEQIDDYEFEHGIGISAAWQDKILTSSAIVQVATACVTPS